MPGYRDSRDIVSRHVAIRPIISICSAWHIGLGRKVAAQHNAPYFAGMLPPPIVKQPHYVWRHYLEAWEVNGKLHVLRNGRYFPSAAKGVAKEGGFHDLPELSEDDIQFLIATCIRPGSPQEKQHREFIDLLVAVQKVSTSVVTKPEDYDEETLAWANKFLRDTEEELVSSVETLGLPWLAALREGDCSFLKEPDSDLFFYFLAMQYLRTKAIAQSVLQSVRGSDVRRFAQRLERTWPIMRQIHSVDVAANLFRTRSSYDLVFLDNDSDIDFITGDQPIVNIHAVTRRDVIPDKFELYYPLTPRRAMLWSQALPGQQGSRIRVGDSVVQHHNKMMAAAAHEMVFGTSKESVEAHKPG
jgi:hypothetical protein